MNKIVTTIALAVALCGLHFGALGQPYPSRPVRMIMPFPPGGSTDVLGRIVAEQLTSAFGQPVLVDNRAGASAQIGTEVVAKAAPDGYTLLAGTSTNAINHALNPKLPYDFSKDFAPIALVMSAGQVLVVHPSVPARTVREFIAYAKERTAPLPYASSGSGSAAGNIESGAKSMASSRWDCRRRSPRRTRPSSGPA